MMCMYLSMWMHTHIYSWKLSPGLVLLAKVCPWWKHQQYHDRLLIPQFALANIGSAAQIWCVLLSVALLKVAKTSKVGAYLWDDIADRFANKL